MDDTSKPNPYDAVPYQSGSFPQTHPQHLATLATMFGMSPPDVETCRVLELGCAEGGNLIPLAADLPTGRFLGIDYSANQIRTGAETIQAVGLPNIELRQADIRELDRSLETFDYIIAHGVYSWVPDDVRLCVLEVCRDHLAENGIAFISFNAMPGGHIRNMVRDMMMFHTRHHSDPATQVSESRRLLDFLIDAAPENHTAYREILEWERRHIRQCLDHQLQHDLLEEVNDPIAIADFMERAEKFDLQYLGDANFSSMLPRNLGTDVLDQLKTFSRSVIEMEQYMDFVRNRAFRQTLLCRQAVTVNHQVDPRVIERFFIAGKIVAADESQPMIGRMKVAFRGADGSQIKTRSPITKAAFSVLADAWPANLAFSELLERSRLRLKSAGFVSQEPGDREVSELRDSLMTCYSNRLVELCVRKNACAEDIPDRPVSAALARFQAEHGDIVTNLRHETVRLKPLQRAVLQQSTGAHTRESMCDSVVQGESQSRTRIDSAPHSVPTPHFESTAAAQTALGELKSFGLLLQ